MLSQILYGSAACIAAVVLFCCGRRFPTQKIKSDLIAEGQEQRLRNILHGFIDRPWVCVHVRKGSYCVVAELVSGERRISLLHTDIPHGAMVHFIEKIQGDIPHELLPFLGGLERELRMTVSCKPSLLNEEDSDRA